MFLSLCVLAQIVTLRLDLTRAAVLETQDAYSRGIRARGAVAGTERWLGNRCRRSLFSDSLLIAYPPGYDLVSLAFLNQIYLEFRKVYIIK